MRKSSGNQSGFTLIEAVTGVMITLLAASAIMMGVSKAQSTLNSIHLRERAFEELKIYTDYWKSMAAAKRIGATNSSNMNGERVALIKDKNGNTVVSGSLYRKIRRGSDSGEYSIYYNIKTYIEWEDNVFGGKELKRLEFNTKQLQFNL